MGASRIRLLDPLEFYFKPVSLLRRVDDDALRLIAVDDSHPATPAIEITERDHELVVTAELPGLAAEHVKVELMGDLLVIQGERRPERDQETVRHGWRRPRHFYREIVLPNGIEAENARAEISNGVLRVHIPVARRSAHRILFPSGQSQDLTDGDVPQQTSPNEAEKEYLHGR